MSHITQLIPSSPPHPLQPWEEGSVKNETLQTYSKSRNKNATFCKQVVVVCMRFTASITSCSFTLFLERTKSSWYRAIWKTRHPSQSNFCTKRSKTNTVLSAYKFCRTINEIFEYIQYKIGDGRRFQSIGKFRNTVQRKDKNSKCWFACNSQGTNENPLTKWQTKHPKTQHRQKFSLKRKQFSANTSDTYATYRFEDSRTRVPKQNFRAELRSIFEGDSKICIKIGTCLV